MTTVYYADDWLTILAGDAREQLATLPEKSVHMCMTSPPFFGLRRYLFADAMVLRRDIDPPTREAVECELEALGVRPR